MVHHLMLFLYLRTWLTGSVFHWHSGIVTALLLAPVIKPVKMCFTLDAVLDIVKVIDQDVLKSLFVLLKAADI